MANHHNANEMAPSSKDQRKREAADAAEIRKQTTLAKALKQNLSRRKAGSKTNTSSAADKH